MYQLIIPRGQLAHDAQCALSSLTVSIVGLVIVLLLTALVLRSISYTIVSGSKDYSYDSWFINPRLPIFYIE